MSKPAGAVSPGAARKLSQKREIFLMFPAPNCDENLFRAQIDLLREQGHEVQVEHIGQKSIGEFAQEIREKYPQEVHLIGVSIGAHIALEVFALDVARVKSLTLISMKKEKPSKAKQEKREGYVRDLSSENKEEKFHEITEEICSRMFFEKNPEVKKLNATYHQMAQHMGLEALKNQVQQMIEVGKKDIFADVPPNSKTVINLVVGEKDLRFRDAGDNRPIHEIAEEMRGEMKERIGGEINLCMIGNAGHLPTIERAEEMNHFFQNLLSRFSPQAEKSPAI